MALNFADRMAVRGVIVSRCTSVVANYALFILGEDPGTANHANRINWARDAIKSAGGFGESVSWHVLNQTPFINNGSGITDAELTGAVETAINNHYITPA
jgi:hypothetical protein